jgi:glutaredoxin 2
MESRPVIQEIDESYAENFWINIRKQYKGIPDELKADVIKNQIINQDFEITLDTMEQYISKIPNNKKDIEKLLKDKNAKKVLIEEDDPLIQQLVSTFSNQKLAQTIDATNKLVQYMSEIDKLRNKKDKQN